MVLGTEPQCPPSGTQYLHVRNNGARPAGCSKSSSSKAAASEDPQAYPLGYVEGLNDARTTLASFFSILLNRLRSFVIVIG